MSTNIIFEYKNTFSFLKKKKSVPSAGKLFITWAFQHCGFLQFDGESSHVFYVYCYTEG